MTTKTVKRLGTVQLETLMALDGATKLKEYADTNSILSYLETFDPFVTVDALGKRLSRLLDYGFVVRKSAPIKGRYVWRLSAKGKRKVQ